MRDEGIDCESVSEVEEAGGSRVAECRLDGAVATFRTFRNNDERDAFVEDQDIFSPVVVAPSVLVVVDDRAFAEDIASALDGEILAPED
ncbi:MAG: hypothetical protein M3279_12820 [Actinomycetota bacterium]|nr:hypothetical protein [Actinomycetota bacterium]